jgi:hypothetical protein
MDKTAVDGYILRKVNILHIIIQQLSFAYHGIIASISGPYEKFNSKSLLAHLLNFM